MRGHLKQSFTRENLKVDVDDFAELETVCSHDFGGERSEPTEREARERFNYTDSSTGLGLVPL